MARLNTCHDDLQLIFSTVIASGYDCTIICGHRTKGKQETAFMGGFSQVHWPDSKHNTWPSMATDAGPYFKEIKNLDWDDVKAFALFAGWVLCVADQLYREGRVEHRLKWGGDWDMDGRTTNNWVDAPHFELVPQ
jgi:peptidoglycan L-alanyl-D-glutamate endopeptidase CwlK